MQSGKSVCRARREGQTKKQKQKNIVDPLPENEEEEETQKE